MCWYCLYAEIAQTWGLTPPAEQQIGGLYRCIPGGLSYLKATLLLLLLVSRLRLSDREQPARFLRY